MIQLLIFDWDDVFTHGSTDGYFKCYHEAVVGVGIELDEAEEQRRIRSMWGKPHTEELEAVLIDHPELVQEAARLYESHLFGDTFVNSLRIVPGVQSLLHRLANHFTLALATGVHPDLLRDHIFTRFEIPNVFSSMRSSYDLPEPGLAKPNPYAVLDLMHEFGVDSNSTVVIGDATNDVLMAQRAGVEPIVVLGGHLNKQQAIDLGVRYIIPDVVHIEDALVQVEADK